MNITNIKRFAVHDGDGIRTTVFFKGCPLKCRWCHNPEAISPQKQLAFYKHKCVGCGRCANICRCHEVIGGVHVFNRKKCIACGKCTAICPNDALELFGRDVSAGEICDILLKDKSFYDESGGGITLSGGECLLQSKACREILKEMKHADIHTAVDTCGFVSKNAIDDVLDYTDVFLYDIKAIDEDVHIRCTGYSNKLILDNLRYIDSCSKKIEIRIPCVPEYNMGQLEKIAEFLSDFKNIVRVRTLPYHNYAASKYAALDMENTLPDLLPTDAEMKRTESFFKKS